jgi:transglutaminase-like putative cysteine protease
VGSDASHAWVSLYVPGPAAAAGRWADLDPTNKRAPGEDYVTLAIGRDYADVSPVRGVLHGGARHKLHVAVTVCPADTAREHHPPPTIA